MKNIRPETPLLDTITAPGDLRGLRDDQLPQLAEELRAEIIDAVSATGGHLGAGLGVVELTIALHHTFETPKDLLVWDVGHQTYPHKVLTGRRDRIRTLRRGGGLSGFAKRSESPYDTFGAGHSSTSISAGLGMALARDLKKQNHHVVCVIGDGAMSAGMAYEAMNNARRTPLIVILNDNDMSIDRPVGAMSAYLARLVSSGRYQRLRNTFRTLLNALSRTFAKYVRRAEEYMRGMAMGGTLFEELGFYYVGPLDGHNFSHLLPVLRNVRDSCTGPVLVHVVTRKGKGYPPAEKAEDKYHGVSRFNIITGEQEKGAPTPPTWTNVFAKTLIDLAAHDEKIVAITAAMPSGTGLKAFGERFPERMFDVGIAEQHAVTFAAGLATQGFRPFGAIYSTFLQRAYDQVVHDVAVQGLPVRFAIDRAGLVGADGPTHAGAFDVAYLAALPNFILMAPADEAELARMVVTAAQYDEGPCAFRYPRGPAPGVPLPKTLKPLDIGKGRLLRQGQDVAFLNFGARLPEVVKAAEELARRNISTTVADARFAKPLDATLITNLARTHQALLTVEEGSAGGFGACVQHFLAHAGYADLAVRPLCLPDRFINHDSPENMYEEAGLKTPHLVRAALDVLGDSPSVPMQA